MSLGFLDHMRIVPDHRIPGMVTYPLDEVLLATLVGVVCGADDWEGVEEVATGALDWLRGFLPFANGNFRTLSSKAELYSEALKAQGLDDLVCRKLGLGDGEADLGEWSELTERIAERSDTVEIALVGKYVKLHDAYLSVHEALKHAGIHHGCFVKVRWVDAEGMSLEEATRELEQVDGVLGQESSIPFGAGV